MFCQKKYLFCLTLFLSFTSLAKSSDIQFLQKGLKAWQPVEITQTDSALTIVLPEKSIYSEAYDAIVSSGICTPIWTKDVPSSFLKDINEIHIVNKYKAAGFTFETPATTCFEMGKLMDQPAKTLLLSKTHMFMPAK